MVADQGAKPPFLTPPPPPPPPKKRKLAQNALIQQKCIRNGFKVM